LTQRDGAADKAAPASNHAAMHFLALLIQLAAIVTPIVGIVVELRRDISDDEGGGLMQGLLPAPPQALVRA
jgi:hypothetical protein